MLEKKDPKSFSGYGKRLGIMYLSCTHDDNFYIDISIFTDRFQLTFRNSDSDLNLIQSYYNFELDYELYLESFFSLIDEYFYSMDQLRKRHSEFERGIIPLNLIRDNKIKSIM